MRIQKSLIIEFDKQSAKDSALEDWKIDMEREKLDKSNTHSREQSASKLIDISSHTAMSNNDQMYIDFERLSEFFFDLCLSWCQYLDIETFLFFLNGIFINITDGAHINVSTFKPLEKIEVLPIEFFNKLIEYRTACEIQRSQPVQEQAFSYKAWYAWNFGRHKELVKRVSERLRECFPVENNEQGRVQDLWLDMPGAKEGSYADMHFTKLDLDLRQMEAALGATAKLTSSMCMMDQSRQKAPKPRDDTLDLEGQVENQTSQGTTSNYRRPEPAETYTREDRQMDIEQRVMAQLGDRFKNGKLLEISENSYLIAGGVRLPVLGKAVK